MEKRDIMAIVIVAVVTFPILYIAMLFITGAMRIEYGFEQDESTIVRVEQIRHNARRDSIAAQNARIFHAAEQEKEEVRIERERLAEQQARLEMLQAEIERQRAELVAERERLESRMATIPEAEDARLRKLARIYEAMRPVEAAAILETLPDAQVAGIMSRIGDDRQKGRILASLSREKAGRINRLIR